jgi:uncharacterized Zn finger protein (UPF0148 family)
MFINTLDIPNYTRLNQILHTLKHVHQFEFTSHEHAYLQEADQMYQTVQQKIVETSAFNSYHANPEYAKAALITEAVKMLLEIAPKRRKKSAVDESKKKQPKPDFLDVDKDGNKKEPFRKAVADKAKTDKLKEDMEQAAGLSKDHINFDAQDIKRLERISDLDTLKKQAFLLISKTSAKPMRPEKIAWFKQSLANKNKKLDIIKLMYDLMLSGEGHAVIGSKSSMNPSSYRQTFKKKEHMLKEDENLDKAETLLAAKDLSDRLQDMAEDAAKMAVDRLMPLVDVMKSQFGQEPADGFNNVLKAQLQTVLDTIISAKDQTDNAILALQGGQVPNQAGVGDISQPLPGAEQPAQEPAAGPEEFVPSGGAEEFTATPATAGPTEEPLGRSMKEPMAESIQVGDLVKFAYVQGMKPIKGTVLEFVKSPRTQENPYGYMVDIRSGNVIYSVHPDHAQKLMETRKNTLNETRNKCMECGHGWYKESRNGKVKCNECGHLMVLAEAEPPAAIQQLQDMATKGKDANGKMLTQQQKQAAKKAAIDLAKANLEEKLTKRMTSGEIISDFVASDDPKFKGKSKAERTRMALGAYYQMHPEKRKKQESLNNYKAVVESLTTEFNNLMAQFTQHKKSFQRSVMEGQQIDALNEGYGLEGAVILTQLKQIKEQLNTASAQLKQARQEIQEQTQLELKISDRIEKLNEQTQTVPYGVYGTMTDNQRFKKFFPTRSLRQTWMEYNQDMIAESTCVDPQDLQRVQDRLKNSI